MGLPCSRERSVAISSKRPAKIWAALARILARAGPASLFQAGKASWAASAARAISFSVDQATTPTTSSVLDGLRTSRVSPLDDGTHSPPIQLSLVATCLTLSQSSDDRDGDQTGEFLRQNLCL